ncbi:unnamed protein product [Durusdinium trenchii]|uniref:Dolichol kinase n=1 Tax=Durusdinium trenchii TaxID=1381693 RepID=A0ABP0K9R2_9DINO
MRALGKVAPAPASALRPGWATSSQLVASERRGSRPVKAAALILHEAQCLAHFGVVVEAFFAAQGWEVLLPGVASVLLAIHASQSLPVVRVWRAWQNGWRTSPVSKLYSAWVEQFLSISLAGRVVDTEHTRALVTLDLVLFTFTCHTISDRDLVEWSSKLTLTHRMHFVICFVGIVTTAELLTLSDGELHALAASLAWIFVAVVLVFAKRITVLVLATLGQQAMFLMFSVFRGWSATSVFGLLGSVLMLVRISALLGTKCVSSSFPASWASKSSSWTTLGIERVGKQVTLSARVLDIHAEHAGDNFCPPSFRGRALVPQAVWKSDAHVEPRRCQSSAPGKLDSRVTQKLGEDDELLEMIDEADRILWTCAMTALGKVVPAPASALRPDWASQERAKAQVVPERRGAGLVSVVTLILHEAQCLAHIGVVVAAFFAAQGWEVLLPGVASVLLAIHASQSLPVVRVWRAWRNGWRTSPVSKLYSAWVEQFLSISLTGRVVDTEYTRALVTLDLMLFTFTCHSITDRDLAKWSSKLALTHRMHFVFFFVGSVTTAVFLTLRGGEDSFALHALAVSLAWIFVAVMLVFAKRITVLVLATLCQQTVMLMFSLFRTWSVTSVYGLLGSILMLVRISALLGADCISPSTPASSSSKSSSFSFGIHRGGKQVTLSARLLIALRIVYLILREVDLAADIYALVQAANSLEDWIDTVFLFVAGLLLTTSFALHPPIIRVVKAARRKFKVGLAAKFTALWIEDCTFLCFAGFLVDDWVTQTSALLDVVALHTVLFVMKQAHLERLQRWMTSKSMFSVFCVWHALITASVATFLHANLRDPVTRVVVPAAMTPMFLGFVALPFFRAHASARHLCQSLPILYLAVFILCAVFNEWSLTATLSMLGTISAQQAFVVALSRHRPPEKATPMSSHVAAEPPP